MLLVIVLTAVTATLVGATGGSSTYYLSLGDSLATGTQPDAYGVDHPTNQGYADVVWARLHASRPGLRLVKLGCGRGETARSVLVGGVCRGYGAGSQLAEAERFLRAHRGEVMLVTVNVGDNDVEACLNDSGAIDLRCVDAALASLRRDLPRIVGGLRAAGGPGLRIEGLADYDQFLARWLDGPAGRRQARASVELLTRLNRTMDEAYRANGALAADAASRFATTDLHDRVPLPGHGRVPLAVARICRWTWACSPPPVGFNDHARPAGYRALADTLLAALHGR